MKALRTTFAFAVALGAVSTGLTQTYPSRPVTVVIPSTAGGPGEILARILSERMTISLGQPLIVETVPGAGGTIGVGRVARAAPDGYTILLGNWNSNVANGAIYPVTYDLTKDFEPVALLTSAPLWIVSRKTFPANNLTELIAWLRANPDKASAATVGAGTAAHVCGLHFQDKTGTRFQFVPYRGGGAAYQDVVAGHIDLMCAETSATGRYVRVGAIKAFAVLARTRWSGAADVPTTDELGLPGLYISFWQSLWAPRGTPKNVVAKLNQAAVQALGDPTANKRLIELGLEIPSSEQQTPEALGIYHKAEIEKWWPIIKAAGIKVE